MRNIYICSKCIKYTLYCVYTHAVFPLLQILVKFGLHQSVQKLFLTLLLEKIGRQVLRNLVRQQVFSHVLVPSIRSSNVSAKYWGVPGDTALVVVLAGRREEALLPA